MALSHVCLSDENQLITNASQNNIFSPEKKISRVVDINTTFICAIVFGKCWCGIHMFSEYIELDTIVNQMIIIIITSYKATVVLLQGSEVVPV